jgi:hypothetical protein
MINITELRKEFSTKLTKTDNFDDALIKVLWLAYQKGVSDTINQVSGWDKKLLDINCTNGEIL